RVAPPPRAPVPNVTKTPADAGVFVCGLGRDNRCSSAADTPMSPARWSFRALFLTSAIVCFALIGFAIYSQLAWGLEPCPLCIFQRLAFAALGVVLLIGGLHAPRGVTGRRVYG
ncbi:disulfide bond formation protein B, partial [Bacillus sp. SIMBA_005]|uniref:disulfide bond formation protein B n=1 Tax=Bacillus sp. SIMBA_005 TaxID=3085754 RepID=UPI0039786A13